MAAGRNILNDDTLNAQMLEQGYVHLEGFLNADELEFIRNAYKSYDPNIHRQYYSTIDSADNNYKSHVNQSIRKAISRSSGIYLNHYVPMTGNFVVKTKGKKSKVNMHFDISCVDEEEFESCVVWIPLTDVDAQNGALQMLKGSHKFMNKVRGPGVKRFYEELYPYFEKNMMTVVPMKAGDALVFLNRALHFSAPNSSESPRVSMRIDMVPEEAQTIMYYWEKWLPGNMVEVYKIGLDFYENFVKESKPVGAILMAYKENIYNELSKEELLKYITR